jgi:DNA-directed RNA polymerase specialized sigma24 family protein
LLVHEDEHGYEQCRPGKAVATGRAVVIAWEGVRRAASMRRTRWSGPPRRARGRQLRIIRLERSALVSALRALPPRRRELLVLRHYTDLSQAQIAATMGISKGAVKSHTARTTSAP